MVERCKVECGLDVSQQPPPIPEDCGIDFTDVKDLCDDIDITVLNGEVKVEVRDVDCEKWDAPSCVEVLAVCASAKCGDGAAPAVYYNVDRVKRWVERHIRSNLAYIVKHCLGVKGAVFRGDEAKLFIEVAQTVCRATEAAALSFLQIHERAHCFGVEDEGEATALALYETYRQYVFDGSRIPIDAFAISRGAAAFVSTLAAHLTLFRIARQHYQMAKYNTFVQYLKLPLTKPTCTNLTQFELNKKGLYSVQAVTSPIHGVMIFIKGTPPLQYTGRRPTTVIRPGECGLYEIWSPCDAAVDAAPRAPTPAEIQCPLKFI